jgi:hypothetical protein
VNVEVEDLSRLFIHPEIVSHPGMGTTGWRCDSYASIGCQHRVEAIGVLRGDEDVDVGVAGETRIEMEVALPRAEPNSLINRLPEDRGEVAQISGCAMF